MKIESIHIQNFKRFEDFHLSFVNETTEEINNRFLILGDNGSGKTTILQAIALVLEMASLQSGIKSVEDFDWIGFVPGRYARWGSPRIELHIEFEQEEIDTTREVARIWRDTAQNLPTKYTEPGKSRKVQLTLDGARLTTKGGDAELYQFRGRVYAAAILNRQWVFAPQRAHIRTLFKKLPGIFWFDQYRNLGSRLLIPDGSSIDHTSSSKNIAYDFGIERLREFLNGWVLGRQAKSYPYDYYKELEKLYSKIFLGHSFDGVEPMLEFSSSEFATTPKDYYFLLNDGNKTYDIAEMSAGEQTVFPILYEVVRRQIAHSIILIDEIDLNLHPPAAQLLVSQLPQIAPNCQFIFTTHSEAVSDLMDKDATYRLQEGVLCL